MQNKMQRIEREMISKFQQREDNSHMSLNIKSSQGEINLDKVKSSAHLTDKDVKRFKIKRVMSDYKYGSSDSRKGTGFNSN